MERKSGFYWVKAYGEWFIAEYASGWWRYPGCEVEYEDSDLESIDETMIPRRRSHK